VTAEQRAAAGLLVRSFAGRDGVELAWRETGAGRPVVLLHGLFGNGAMLADGRLARSLAAAGRRVILPDLRAHGASGHPHDPACYPPDVLADDGLALIEQLGLDDYDLGGYSLGGKLVLRLLARGARPARAFVGGQGADALDAESSRTGRYRELLETMASGNADPDSPAAGMARWLAQAGTDPRAVGLLLGTMVSTPRGVLRQVTVPVLIVTGDRDSRGATAGELAGLLPDARVVTVPGDHESTADAPELAAAVLDFLG